MSRERESLSGIKFYEELSREDNIIGVKFTSKDTFELQQLIEACGPSASQGQPDYCRAAEL
ncbi:MAG: hypothetical protein K0R57_5557 [Paenibacillaceae bacterium]|nr:hypothetical protein [Paenibacillaceae bacterium]